MRHEQWLDRSWARWERDGHVSDAVEDPSLDAMPLPEPIADPGKSGAEKSEVVSDVSFWMRGEIVCGAKICRGRPTLSAAFA
jgi:hypothetical protein